MSIQKRNESADKPGSVVDNHSSAIRVTAYLQRPTRESVWATHATQSEDWTARSPIWSCSGRGLPCHRVLPPARCALTAPFHPYRRVAEAARLGGLLSVALSVDSRPPGVTWRLALGARTFLHPCEQRLSGRLAANHTEARGECWPRFYSSRLPPLNCMARAYKSLRFSPLSFAATFAACDGDNSSSKARSS